MKLWITIVLCCCLAPSVGRGQSDTVPTLTWASYFGEKRDDRLIDVARYLDGGYVVAGTTFADSADIVIARFSADGVRQWVTIIGGEGADVPTAIVVTKSGDVFLAGHTRSTNGIATRGAYLEVSPGLQDGFLMQFDAQGQRVWGSYFGGSEDDAIFDMVQSDRGDLVIVGATRSKGLATSDGAQPDLAGGMDGIAAVMTIDGFPVTITYFGGSADDELRAVAGDGQGWIYVAGTTASEQLATASAAQTTFGGGRSDAVLAGYASLAQLSWATYVGGTEDDAVHGPALAHANGHVYLAGTTTSRSQIAFPGAYHEDYLGEQDGFVVCHATNGEKVFGTYLGGKELDDALAVVTNTDNEAVVIGWSKSDAEIATVGAFQERRQGEADAVIWCLSADGQLRWATYFGGTDLEVGASACVLGQQEYLMVGETSSTSGLAVLPPHQANLSSTVNGYMAKLGYCEAPKPAITGLDTACLDGQQRTYQTTSVVGNTYLWEQPRLGTLVSSATESQVTLEWTTPGLDTLIVYETTAAGCRAAARLVVFVSTQPDPTISSSTGLFEACEGDTLILTVKDSTASVSWSTGETTRSISVTQTSTLNVTISNGACSTIVKGLVVTFRSTPQPQIAGSATVCRSDDAEFSYAISPLAGSTIQWQPLSRGSYRTRTDTSHVRVTWSTVGVDTIGVVQTTSEGCTAQAWLEISISEALAPRLISSSGDTILCAGDSLVLRLNGVYTDHEWSTGAITDSLVVRQPGSYSVKVGLGPCTGFSDTLTIVERQRPDPRITGPVEVCLAEAQQATFTVSTEAGTTVLWEAPTLGTARTPLNGETLTVEWDAAGTETLRVQVFAGAACVGTAEIVSEILDAVECASSALIEVADVEFGTLPVDSLINANGGHVHEIVVVSRAAFEVTLDSASVDTSVFSIPAQFPRLLRPGDTSRITIRFAPPAQESYAGTIRVHAGMEIATARVRGTGRELAPDEQVTEVILQPDRVEVQPGDVFEVLLMIGDERPGPASATEYEATLQWDSRVLELISTPEVLFRTTGREDNYFTARIPEGTRMVGQQELIRIPFRAKLADVDSTILVFSGLNAFRWKDDTKAFPACRDSVVKVAICHDPVGRLITKRPMVTLRTMDPTPAEDDVRLILDATATASVIVEVIDPLGTIVLQRSALLLPAGASEIVLDLHMLPSGPYIVRILDGWRGDARTLIKQ